MMCRLARSVTRTLAAATLPIGIASSGLSVSAHAKLSSDRTNTAQHNATPSGSLNAPAQPDRTRQPAFDPIAERLKYLHDRLRITPAQEPLWASLAQVMQENAKAIEPLVKKRLQSTPNRTAIETLSIYEKLGEVQMDGLKKFLTAFQVLYNVLSDQQKKIADVLFRTSPLSMVGSIPELPEQIFELAPRPLYAYNALPPLPGPPAYPLYEYGRSFPAYPYYPPWILAPPIGPEPSFVLLFPRHFHHQAFVPFHHR